MVQTMRRNDGVADTSFGPQYGERAVWDMESPDRECECPGPPPRFYLPPPPRPFVSFNSSCSESSISDFETCEAMPVIDAEYHFSPAIPSLAIALIVVAAVVAFLLIGIILVLLKKRRMQQHLLPRKWSLQNNCSPAVPGGITYEDLATIQPRVLPPHCRPTQTAIPSIEMMNVASYSGQTVFGPTILCSPSSAADSYNSQDLFNPVYEELSNGSGERGETDSEGMARASFSEDEFAEDELSFGGGEPENHLRGPRATIQDSEARRRGPIVTREFSRDADSSDVDDRSRFIIGPGKNFSLPAESRDERRRTLREVPPRTTTRRSRSLDKKKGWRKKGPVSEGNDFHEALLLKTILQLCPEATGPGPGPGPPPADASPRSRPAAAVRVSGKSKSQDSSFGSDSGYSNAGGGKPSFGDPRDFRLTNRGDFVLS